MRHILQRVAVITAWLGASACRHNTIHNTINDPLLTCGEEALQSNAYYLKVLDKDGNDRRSPDTIIDLEMQDNNRDVPESQQLNVNAKGCFKVEEKWATVYIFDFNKHQGKIIRLAQIEKGRIHDISLEQISLEQEAYEFRECNHLVEAETIRDRMVYDLADMDGAMIDSRKYRALFINAQGEARKLIISEGSCVVERADVQGTIVFTDGIQVLEYPARGRVGESEPYTRTQGRKSALTVQDFQKLFDKAS